MEEQNLEKKKRPAGFKAGLAILIVAVLAIGAVASAKVIKGIRKMTMDTAEYYQYVETKNRDEKEQFLTGYYDVMRESVLAAAKGSSANMKLEISDTAKALLSLSGIDFSEFQNAELDVLTGKENSAYSTQIKLKGEDEDILTLNAYMDIENQEAYYQIPELSKSYLDISAIFQEEGIDTEDGDNAEEGIQDAYALAGIDLEKLFVESDEMKTIFERYTDILIKNAKNVEKSEGGCEAEGVSQEAEKYTVAMNGKELAELLKELLETLKNDETVKKIIEDIDAGSYSEFVKDIDSSLAELSAVEDEEDEIKAAMEVQVSSDERIIGRDLTVEADGEKLFGMKFAMPQDGDAFGCIVSITADDGSELLAVRGSGTFKRGILNGEFTIGMDDSLNEGSQLELSTEKLLIVKFEDYDMSKLADGKIKGAIIYSTEAVAALANYSLKVEVEGDSKESNGTIKLLAGQDALATLTIAAKTGVAVESTKPSGSDTVYDAQNEGDMLRYSAEMDILQVLADLQEKLGINFSGLMGLLGGLDFGSDDGGYGFGDLDEGIYDDYDIDDGLLDNISF